MPRKVKGQPDKRMQKWQSLQRKQKQQKQREAQLDTMAEIQRGACKPLDCAAFVIPSGDIVATILLDSRQKWEYEIIPSSLHYRLHHQNVTITMSRERFENGWEIIKEG